MEKVWARAEEFMYRHARPLDMARWLYHFEKGSSHTLLNILSHYQNEDGGFGYGLEADSWNPHSTPIQTWSATEILREIGWSDSNHPIIQGILQYLASGNDFDGHFWFNTVQSNNDYPHAPWWHYNGESNYESYNPTACLAGFIIRYADRNSDLYETGRSLAQEAYEAYSKQTEHFDMHTELCFARLLEYSKEARENSIDLLAFEKKVKNHVERSITCNTEVWETEYICKPSQFLNTMKSIFYPDNQDIAQYECEFIVQTQLCDGSWHIPWQWSNYLEAWAVSKNWWKADVVIKNLLFLKGIDRNKRSHSR